MQAGGRNFATKNLQLSGAEYNMKPMNETDLSLSAEHFISTVPGCMQTDGAAALHAAGPFMPHTHTHTHTHTHSHTHMCLSRHTQAMQRVCF